MVVQPQLQRRTHITRNQPNGIPGIQALLDLPLELRVKHLGRQHITGPGKNVFRQQLDAFWQERVQLNKAFDSCEKTITQPAFVGAARARRNQVDVTFTHRLTIFGESNTPAGPLAFGKAVVGCIGIALTLKHRDHQIAVERLQEVVTQAALVEPGLCFLRLFVDQRDADTRHEHGLAS